jgi:hypothetical protein
MIELLNGEMWQQEAILEKMKDDNFYYGHLGKYALSSSACKQILDSPKQYHYITKYGQQETDSLNIGRLVHLMALEPHRMEEINVVEVQSRVTKAFKDAPSGSITRKEYNEASRIADALLRNSRALSFFEGCEFEVPAIGSIGDLPFRAKADMYDPDQKFICDLKTTADLKGFKVSAQKYSYDLQAAIYCKLFDVSPERFIFIVIDKGSLDVGIYTIKPSFVERGAKKLQEAISLYKQFFIEGEDLDSYTIIGELE